MADSPGRDPAAAPFRVLLVANVLTHYRLPLYEELQERVRLELIFFSDGQEWYWRRTEEPGGETLQDARWLKGWWVGRTRIVPGLVASLWRSRADVIIKDPTGKFALPVTYDRAATAKAVRLLGQPLRASIDPLPAVTDPLMRHLSDGRRHRHLWPACQPLCDRRGGPPDRVLEAPQAGSVLQRRGAHEGRWRQPLQLLYVRPAGDLEGRPRPARRPGPAGDPRLAASVAGRGSQEATLRAQAASWALPSSRLPGPRPQPVVARAVRVECRLVVPSIRTAIVTEVWRSWSTRRCRPGSGGGQRLHRGAVHDGLVRDGHSSPSPSGPGMPRLAGRLRTAPTRASRTCERWPQPASREVGRYSLRGSRRGRSVVAATLPRRPAGDGDRHDRTSGR